MAYAGMKARLVAAALLGFGGLFGAAHAQESKLTPFVVGQSAPSNTFLAIWMAEAAGLYQAQGLKMTVVPMTGGSGIGPALTSGSIQIMHIGMSSVVRANAAGHRLRTVASLSNVIRFTLFTGAKIKTPADLKGGAVGITSVGSETDATLGLALQKIGLTRQDVTVKEVGARRLPALRDGEVAAALLSEPERSQAPALGLNPMVDLLKDQTPWIFTGLVVDESYLKDHRDAVARFLRATAEGNYMAISDAGRAKQVLAKELRMTDPKTLELTYANFRSETPRNIEPSRAGGENIIRNVAPPTASRRIEDYIDASVWEDLMREGLFETLAARYKP
jgi:NitT/TauT family transport system substrate-binding protein